MNIADAIILIILALSFFIGIYNGFTVTLLNIISAFASWIGAICFYPNLSQYIIKNTSFFDKLKFYVEGATKIPSSYDKMAKLSAFSPKQIGNILKDIHFPYPFNIKMTTNVINQSSLDKFSTLGEYFDYSIAMIIMNILSFLIIFLAIKLIFSIIISIAKNVTHLPVLRQLDGLLGGVLGIIRGAITLFIVFIFISLLNTVVPMDRVNQILESSYLARFFI
ncbi:CvpA family protein [Xylanivirga thermophila]|jgi:uncharacterized membrane protein required for colicin V production|uniref:CvpA family protein n=1 Tax=Xylanivirga thermophila TaxID=2496273 RepID=UPI00101D29FF|nr:CvpA family protein [Xylanivirga thermophila]